MDVDAGWAVVVPVKELHLAKSRLRDLTPLARTELALAMAADVVAAALASPAVVGVVAVTNDVRAAGELAQLGAHVTPDAAGAGIDKALAGGAGSARERWPASGVAALSSDLPCATPNALRLALHRASAWPRAVLADRGGEGTTLLTARPGEPLDPAYGDGSRARHVLAGAVQLDPAGLDRLTLDVDTTADLVAALALGVGPRTAAVMLRVGSR